MDGIRTYHPELFSDVDFERQRQVLQPQMPSGKCGSRAF
jgi:hypothetical protein